MKTNAANRLKKEQRSTAARTIAFLVFSALITASLLISGCTASPPLTQFENSLITHDSKKASVVIYRSTDESWAHRVFTDIYVDGQPFIRILRGEYIQTYLPVGAHTIIVKYDRYPDTSSIAEDQKVIDSKHGDVVYVEIVPSFEGWDWVCGVTYFPICFPMPRPKVELILKTAKDALNAIGKRIDRQSIKERRIIKY